jgi:hypothetical protein
MLEKFCELWANLPIIIGDYSHTCAGTREGMRARKIKTCHIDEWCGSLFIDANFCTATGYFLHA